jgi:hypothetical protein
MARAKREKAPIMPASAPDPALESLCPDLERWPQSWRYEELDIAYGERIVECFKPFLLDLIEQALTPKTFKRHRDHLWMLGGEIIRRVNEEPTLRRKSIEALLLDLIDDECGPLIWPKITEQQQNSFDATCRKLYQFMTMQSKPAAQQE